MSVAPIDYDEDVTSVTVSDSQYAAALRGQQQARARRFRLVKADPESAPLEVAVSPIDVAERSEAMELLALRLLEHVLRTTRGKQEVHELLASAWPWASRLPDHEVIAMVDELNDILLSARRPEAKEAAARQLLIEWEHTAEIYANPGLFERLTTDTAADFGSVPRPESGEGEDDTR